MDLTENWIAPDPSDPMVLHENGHFGVSGAVQGTAL